MLIIFQVNYLTVNLVDDFASHLRLFRQAQAKVSKGCILFSTEIRNTYGRLSYLVTCVL